MLMLKLYYSKIGKVASDHEFMVKNFQKLVAFFHEIANKICQSIFSFIFGYLWLYDWDFKVQVSSFHGSIFLIINLITVTET